MAYLQQNYAEANKSLKKMMAFQRLNMGLVRDTRRDELLWGKGISSIFISPDKMPPISTERVYIGADFGSGNKSLTSLSLVWLVDGEYYARLYNFCLRHQLDQIAQDDYCDDYHLWAENGDFIMVDAPDLSPSSIRDHLSNIFAHPVRACGIDNYNQTELLDVLNNYLERPAYIGDERWKGRRAGDGVVIIPLRQGGWMQRWDNLEFNTEQGAGRMIHYAKRGKLHVQADPFL